jgi:inhibitor of KinA sporulation pathway (predicted exonuclease)
MQVEPDGDGSIHRVIRPAMVPTTSERCRSLSRTSRPAVGLSSPVHVRAARVTCTACDSRPRSIDAATRDASHAWQASRPMVRAASNEPQA